MKRISVMLLSAILLFGMIACGGANTAPAQTAEQPAETQTAEPQKEVSYVEQTISAADLNGKVKLIGKAAFTESGLATDWSGSGIEFTAACSGDIIIHVAADFKTYASKTGADQIYRVFIDGEALPRRVTIAAADGKTDYKIAGGLTEGTHTIAFRRETDSFDIELFITGITMTCDKDTIQPTADKKLLLEFIGTSITSGSGLLGADTSVSSYTLASATRAYPTVTCQLLDADETRSSRGSMGVICTVKSGDVRLNFPTYYPLAYAYRDTETKYVYTREPDVVCIDIGPNDSVSMIKDNDGNPIYTAYKDLSPVFRDAAVAFIKQVRALHPNAKIVMVHGMMNCASKLEAYDTNGVLVEGKSEYQLIEEALAAEGITGVSDVLLKNRPDAQSGEKGSGRGGHPNEEEHLYIGQQLAEYLKNSVLK